jgi:hypothetical protein
MKIPAGSIAEMKGVPTSGGFSEHLKVFTVEVELLKKLVKSAWYDPAASEKKDQEKKIKEFKKLETIFEKEIADFSKEESDVPSDRINKRIVALTVFMYLFDTTLMLYKAVLKKNKVGLYSLFDSTRNSLYNILSKKYFKRPYVEVMRGYLETEPRLVACAELSEVELIAIHKAVEAYQPKLADLVDKKIGAKKKPSKKKSKKSKR